MRVVHKAGDLLDSLLDEAQGEVGTLRSGNPAVFLERYIGRASDPFGSSIKSIRKSPCERRSASCLGLLAREGRTPRTPFAT